MQRTQPSVIPSLENESSSASRTPVLGVLGGMGPMATLHFLSRVMALTPAKTDQEHLRIQVDINPQVPNRNEAIADGQSLPAHVLVEMAKGLVQSGAQYLAMPCHTAHAFEAHIRQSVKQPFISLVQVTVEALCTIDSVRSVGLLATQGCIESGVYQRALSQVRPQIAVQTLPQAQQTQLMELIYAIKSNPSPWVLAQLAQQVQVLIEALASQGADVVVLGCTELPMLWPQIPTVQGTDELAVTIVNPTELLAQACVEYALQFKSHLKE